MKEKQIEEMARIICKPTANKGNCERCGFHKQCSKFDDATDLYNEGYRRQSEGEWIWTENGDEDYEQFWICSVCNEKSYTETKFCPDCGAKMKGGAQE